LMDGSAPDGAAAARMSSADQRTRTAAWKRPDASNQLAQLAQKAQ
jgi:hypothetical protein